MGLGQRAGNWHNSCLMEFLNGIFKFVPICRQLHLVFLKQFLIEKKAFIKSRYRKCINFSVKFSHCFPAEVGDIPGKIRIVLPHFLIRHQFTCLDDISRVRPGVKKHNIQVIAGGEVCFYFCSVSIAFRCHGLVRYLNGGIRILKIQDRFFIYCCSRIRSAKHRCDPQGRPLHAGAVPWIIQYFFCVCGVSATARTRASRHQEEGKQDQAHSGAN